MDYRDAFVNRKLTSEESIELSRLIEAQRANVLEAICPKCKEDIDINVNDFEFQEARP